jgi:serine/threonine protein kinase
MAAQPTTRPADRSDSGPPGRGYRKALGLDDPGLLMDLILPETLSAITAEGLDQIAPVDRGGYGIILKAADRLTGNPRAVKVVLEPHDAHRLQIFRRECRVLDSKDLPRGIAPKFYAAREPRGGQPFLVQEWIEGKKLSDWLDSNPTLTMSQRESVCRAIFATYAALHKNNLIHRDVSLGNIMIAGRSVRLIDFGGAGRAAAGYRSFNTHSKVPTTEAFASGPVLRQERKPSIADEVHAVAKVCFTVLTGEYASELNSADLRRQAMKRAGCASDLIDILVPKMDDPPLQLALQTAPLEFGDE